MKYKMKVTITPTAEVFEFYPEATDMTFDLVCAFAHQDDTYGNGYWMGISGKGFGGGCFDIRYDTTFDPNKAGEYLEKWARSYWCGKDGAYAIKELTIEKA